MKLLQYIWRNVTRNRLRTILTVLSVGFSLALMTVLYGYMAMGEAWGGEALKHNRIVSMNAQGFADRVPIAYVDKIRGMEGVRAAVPYSWFGGTYKEERTVFAQFGTDPKEVLNVWDEYTIAPDQLKAWQENRRGCVVDRRLAERWGWEIGEKIPLAGTYYPFTLDLELVGVFDTPQPVDTLWFHWEYLDEGMRVGDREKFSGNAAMIFIKAESSKVIPALTKKIDDAFANSEYSTRTQTEAAFAQMFADMVGNVQALIRFIGIAVVFSLTLVTANAMAMSLRERTTEIAVLKAIGFTRNRVLSMILGESCLIAAIGGFLGLALGCLCIQFLHRFALQVFPFSVIDIVGVWMMWIIGIAAGIGFVSGMFPALAAAQRPVVDGLRRVI